MMKIATYTFTSWSRQASRSRLTTGSSLAFLTRWTRGALDTSGALENVLENTEISVDGQNYNPNRNKVIETL